MFFLDFFGVAQLAAPEVHACGQWRATLAGRQDLPGSLVLLAGLMGAAVGAGKRVVLCVVFEGVRVDLICGFQWLFSVV